MYVLEEAVRLISQSPGNIVYFLVTLFALQQAFVSALSARRAAPDLMVNRRWLWSAGAMVVTRLLLIAVGLLGVAGLIVPSNFMPPLERWILVATALLIAWAGLYSYQPRGWQTSVLLLLLGLSAIVYGVGVAVRATAGSELPAFLDLYVLEQVSVLVAFVLLLVLAAAIRSPHWEWIAGVALFWALGTVAQLVWVDPTSPVDGWHRLASLVALPLLSILVHRQVMTAPAPAPPKDWLPDAVSLTEMVQAIGGA
ncbi:MAG: hypothetical protein ACP5HS_04500, partial [Anaerolineae bacterium]